MLALHATWGLDRNLHLWAEDAAAYEDSGASVTRSARRTPAAHPFALPSDRLGDLLASLGLLAPEGNAAALELALPTRDGVPQPSPALPVTPLGDGAAPVLGTWRVPSRALDGEAAVALLESLGEAVGLAEVDASLRFWARLARLALEMVARGRVLPGIREPARRRFVARWEPVPGSGDGTRLRALARAMPIVCRAAGSDGAPRSANDTVAEALGVLVDAQVRRGLARAAGSQVPCDDRWPPSGPWASLGMALCSTDPGLAVGAAPAVDAASVRALGRVLAAWRARCLPTEGPLRTVFRLVEPGHGRAEADAGVVGSIDTAAPHDAPDVDAAPHEPWRLEIMVGARDEPSLLVGAAEVWADPRVLARAVPNVDADEVLLVDLVRASRLYPPLEGALALAPPDALELDTGGAHAFLREGAPLLADAGFGVLLPAWWTSRRRRIGLRVRVRGHSGPARTGVGPSLGARSLVDCELSAALGDTPLTEAELRTLARLKTPLVRVRGEWVEVQPGEIAAALRAVSATPEGGARTMTVGEFLRFAGASDGELPVTGIEAQGWVEGLLRADETLRAEPMATPAGFVGQLRAYQQLGLGWLTFLDRLGLGACLADDMGLGKTAQLLALLVAEREPTAPGAPVEASTREGGPLPDGVPPGPRPTLVVCPMSVVGNWQKEARRFAPGLRVHVHHGASRLAGGDLATAVNDADLAITTYAIAARDVDALAAIAWGRVVLDEAQVIKNSETRQSRAVRRLPAAARVALTGTPVENRLTELWSIMEFLNPGLLGPEASFRDRFALPIEQDGDEEAVERLRRLTGPFILRRLKRDPAIGLELPEKFEMTVPCNLTREQATLYQSIVDDMLAQLDRAEGIRRRGLVLKTIGRLKQVCNHPAQALGDGSALEGRSGKLAQLEDLLEEALAAGDRTLVFTQYTEWAERLRPYLRERFGREVLYFHGGLTQGARDQLIERFQAGAAPILILSLRAGGQGINLTAANQVVHFDRWWNPAVEDQASDRAYRIGQTRDVQVRRLVCTGTIEERIAEMNEAKRNLAARVVGTGEQWLGDLSIGELRELLALSADAVAER
ncbi:MAG: SNF2-related protein [Candidatus Limnocylindrales bacterium]